MGGGPYGRKKNNFCFCTSIISNCTPYYDKPLLKTAYRHKIGTQQEDPTFCME